MNVHFFREALKLSSSEIPVSSVARVAQHIADMLFGRTHDPGEDMTIFKPADSSITVFDRTTMPFKTRKLTTDN